MKPSLQILNQALKQSWSFSTAHPSVSWTQKNPARGHCVVSSLIVQDYFGGELVRYSVVGDGIDETHFCNQLDGDMLVDTTISQYQTGVKQTLKPEKLDGYDSTRERLLSDIDTRNRYAVLKTKVEQYIL